MVGFVSSFILSLVLLSVPFVAVSPFGLRSSGSLADSVTVGSVFYNEWIRS